MLEIVGLSEDAERVYADLVTSGAADIDTVAARAGLSVPATEAVIAELQPRGLLVSRPGDPHSYAAAPPSVALEALLAQQRHALHQAELAAVTLAESYRSGTAERSDRDLIEVLTGGEAIRHRFEQIQRSATWELLALVTERPTVVRTDENAAELEAVQRGVTYRVVLEREALSSPEVAESLAASVHDDKSIRVIERVPSKLIIADRATALVPLGEVSETGSPTALLVRAAGLNQLLIGLFESTWDRAQPIRMAALHPAAEGPDTLDLRILSLLLVGSTDVAIGNQLGLGLRTVQRRIKHLMVLASAETRIQLGWQAHRRGWVR
jgi:sugar-specific transcriptional regulator TrmB